MTIERDTKFLGFAELLANDLAALNSHRWNTLDEYIATKRLLIAQRAYDLAFHVATSLDSDIPWRLWRETIEQVIEHDVPDLTQWPESPIPEPS